MQRNGLKFDALEKHEKGGMFLFYTLFWFAFTLVTGTLLSGYAIEDDWYIAKMHYLLTHENSFIEEMIVCLRADIAIRLRPAYFFIRVIEVAIYENNLLVWSISRVFYAIIISFFLFRACRRFKFNFITSAFFPLFVLLGEQSSIIWKRAPAEAPGMFLLSFLIYLISLSITSDKARKPLFALIVFVTIGMSLCKESFILLLPGLWVFWVWMFSEAKKTSLGESVKKLAPSAIIFIFIFTILISFVLTRFGATPEAVSYAGVESFSSGTTRKVLKVVFKCIQQGGLIAALFVFLVTLTKGGFRSRKEFNKCLFPIVFLGLWIIPQIILYTKSGIYARYLIPFTFAPGFTLIWLLNQPTVTKRLSAKVLLVLLLLLFVSKGLSAGYSALRFSIHIGYYDDFLETLVEKTDDSSHIVIVGNSRAVGSVSRYLIFNEIRAEENIEVYLLNEDTLEFFDLKNKPSHGPQGTIDAVALLIGLEKPFLKAYKGSFDLQNAQKTAISKFPDNPDISYTVFSRPVESNTKN